MASELKPCPFCGGDAKTYDYECEEDIYDPDTLGFVDTEYFTRWGCGCETCGAMIPEKHTEAEAIEAWNTRAERTCRNLAVGKDFWDTKFLCSECCHEAYDYVDIGEHCPRCQAKVVE